MLASGTPRLMIPGLALACLGFVFGAAFEPVGFAGEAAAGSETSKLPSPPAANPAQRDDPSLPPLWDPEGLNAPVPIPARIFQLPDASGPPEISCKEALGIVEQRKAEEEANKPPPPAPPPPAPKPKAKPRRVPDISGMEEIILGEEGMAVDDLPGAVPDLLPLQPLEGRAADLERVAEVWRKAEGEKRVRLSFFGASHTEGDWWTGRIRRRLQKRWGDAGHGFVMPAAPVSGYRASDVNLCRTSGWRGDWAGKKKGHADGYLGLGGMSVSSADPEEWGWIETTRTNPQGRKVARYELFTLGQPQGGNLAVVVDDEDALLIDTHSPQPSLQHTRIRVPDGAHRLALAPLGDGPVRIFGISVERDVPGVIVDAMGIRGRTARSMLLWNREQAAAGLATLDPDMVVLAYGTNEANDRNYSMESYASDLRKVLTELRKAAPQAACILVGPSDRGIKVDDEHYGVWHRTEPIAQVQREVAPEFGCVFWDWQQATGGPGSQVAWVKHTPRLASGDLIHYKKAGYEWVADRFVDAIDELLWPDKVGERIESERQAALEELEKAAASQEGGSN